MQRKAERRCGSTSWLNEFKEELSEEEGELNRQISEYEESERLLYDDTGGSCYEPGEEYGETHNDDTFADMAHEPFTEEEIVQIDEKLEDHLALNRECNSKA